MFKMTRQMTGARNVSGHVRAKYQVKSKEEFQFQQKVVNSDKPTVVYFCDPLIGCNHCLC